MTPVRALCVLTAVFVAAVGMLSSAQQPAPLVVTTPGGVIYHRDDCFTIQGRGQNPTPIAEAADKPGAEACSYCLSGKSYTSTRIGAVTPEDAKKLSSAPQEVPAPYRTAPTPPPGALSATFPGNGFAIAVEAKVTEQNDTWWRYSWKLSAVSASSATRTLIVTVQFQDADGFVLDTDSAGPFQLAPGATTTTTDFALVSAATAPRVRKIGIEVRGR